MTSYTNEEYFSKCNANNKMPKIKDIKYNDYIYTLNGIVDMSVTYIGDFTGMLDVNGEPIYNNHILLQCNEDGVISSDEDITQLHRVRTSIKNKVPIFDIYSLNSVRRTMSPDLNFKVIGVAQNGLEEVVFYLKEEDI
jgi:hypothetical protein